MKSSGYCKQLLEKIGLMLHTCVDMCGASEVTAKQMKEMSAAKAVHTISAQCGVYQKDSGAQQKNKCKKGTAQEGDKRCGHCGHCRSMVGKTQKNLKGKPVGKVQQVQVSEDERSCCQLH